MIARLLWPSWRWITISGTPSRAISTAWAWGSWCGAKRRRTPAAAAVRRSSARAAPDDQWRPQVVPVMTQSKAPNRKLGPQLEPGPEFFPSPRVHADLAAAPALAAPDQERAAALIEIALCQGERLVDPQPCSPQEHDQGA